MSCTGRNTLTLPAAKRSGAGSSRKTTQNAKALRRLGVGMPWDVRWQKWVPEPSSSRGESSSGETSEAYRRWLETTTPRGANGKPRTWKPKPKPKTNPADEEPKE